MGWSLTAPWLLPVVLQAEPDVSGAGEIHAAVRGACSGRKNVVELLLAKGADVTAKNEQGLTPNQCAEELGHTLIVELRRQFFK